MQSARAELEQVEAARGEIAARLEKAKSEREPEGPERTAASARLAAATARHAAVSEELAKYSSSDSAALSSVAYLMEHSLAAANRWTDNLWLLKTWLVRTKHIEEATVKSLFKEVGEIKLDTMDYLTQAEVIALKKTKGKRKVAEDDD